MIQSQRKFKLHVIIITIICLKVETHVNQMNGKNIIPDTTNKKKTFVRTSNNLLALPQWVSFLQAKWTMLCVCGCV